jgi:epoxyqueuosine reductase
MLTAEQIVSAAKRCGFDKCGIIPVEKMAGYETRLDKRMERFPETRSHYEDLRGYAHPQEQFPWAKSVIICSYWYGKYKIPEGLQGHIAKYYLTDGRRDVHSPGYQTSVDFEKYLVEAGIKVKTERKFGLTSLRWAAREAGIGLLRKNNFFYTERGSWQYLEAFLIDQPLEYIEKCTLRPYPDHCTLCQRACPTKALAEPYMMNRNACVSCLTTWDGWDMAHEPRRREIGQWIFGCDACQDVCPFNHNSWHEDEEFPGLEELSRHLSLTEILDADYDYIDNVIRPKFWYIPKNKTWRYKVNVINAMVNEYHPEYLPSLRRACHDEKQEVREMAEWALEQLKLDK